MNAGREIVRADSELIRMNAGVRMQLVERVSDLAARIKRIQTTDEGKLQVVLEAEGLDDAALSQVKDMLVLQQSCPVLVSMLPLQRDLFDA